MFVKGQIRLKLGENHGLKSNFVKPSQKVSYKLDTVKIKDA